MNAYIPSLARESPEVIQAGKAFSTDPDPDSISAPLLGTTDAATPLNDHQSPGHEAYVFALSRATSRISSQGIASGYVAGILMLLLALIPVTQLHGSTFSLRLAIGLSGMWWMLFLVPAAMWLPGGSSSYAVNGGDEHLKHPSRIRD